MTEGPRAAAPLEDLLRRLLREELDERGFADAFERAWKHEVEPSSLSQREYDVYSRVLDAVARSHGDDAPGSTETGVRAAARGAAASLRLETV